MKRLQLLGLLTLSLLVPRLAEASELNFQPSNSSGSEFTCMELMIPLYTYPLWFDPANYIWDDIADAAATVPITAIINPQDGPTTEPNADYLVGLADLEAAGVEMIGYVFTSFGNRPIDEVKADLDTWSTAWGQWVTGVFFDESASDASQLDYYEELYDYVKALPALDLVVTNQGTTADEGFLSRPAADVVVSFENFDSAWPDWTPASYASFYPRSSFSMLAHEVPDVTTLQSDLDLAAQRNYGFVYLTDDLFVPNPWDSLPGLWQDEVTKIAAINASCSSASGSFTAGELFSPSGLIEASAGTHIAWLEGPETANAELALLERTLSGWQRVADSRGPRSDEQLAIELEAGTYAWGVLVLSGSGSYNFHWIAPKQP